MRRSRVQLLVAAPSVGHAVSRTFVSACIYRDKRAGVVDMGQWRGQNRASSLGGVPERPKGSDCKSDGVAFVGSNPTPSTRQFRFRSGCVFGTQRCAKNSAGDRYRFENEREEMRGGYGSMVEPQPSKLMVRVRFPLPAPSPSGRVHLGKIRQEGFDCSHSSVGRALPW
jgi:hypothetical protein